MYVYPTRSPAFLGQVASRNRRTMRRMAGLGWYKRAGLSGAGRLGQDDSSDLPLDIVGPVDTGTNYLPTDTSSFNLPVDLTTSTYTPSYATPTAPSLTDLGVSAANPLSAPLIGVGIPSAGTSPTFTASAAAGSIGSSIAQIVAGITGAPKAGTAAVAAPASAGISPTLLLLGAGGILLVALLAGGGGGRR